MCKDRGLRFVRPTLLNMFLEPVCFFFEMGVRGKMITCGNKFLLTISNKKEIVYELEFTMIIEDGPREGSTDFSSEKVLIIAGQ